MNDRFSDADPDSEHAEARAEDRRRVLPWVMLSLPFSALLIFVLVTMLDDRFGDRLERIEAQQREERALYAIRRTPQSSVEILREAFATPAAERTEAAAWALDDLARRAGVEDEDDLGARFLAEWGEEPAPVSEPR